MHVVVVVQARSASTRLPGKAQLDLAGEPLVHWALAAGRASGFTTVLATTTAASDDELAEWAERHEGPTFRGPVDDVLGRFVLVAQETGADVLVRLTGDCPFLDPDLITTTVAALQRSGCDYASTTMPRTLARGLDVEAVRASVLGQVANAAESARDREHVTTLLRRMPDRWNMVGITFHPPSDDLRLTIDTQEDLQAARQLVADLGGLPRPWREVVRALRERPDLIEMTRHVKQRHAEA